jgi:ATP-dependent Clp protease ATP-binding subunit ClpC
MKDKLLGEVKKAFKPEFLNRIDSVVVFHPLNKEQIRQIVDLMLATVTKQLAEKEIKLRVSDEAKDFLGKKGYDEIYGARPLRRVIQEMLEDRISEDILRGNFKTGDIICVDMEEDNIIISAAPPEDEEALKLPTPVGALPGDSSTDIDL